MLQDEKQREICIENTLSEKKWGVAAIKDDTSYFKVWEEKPGKMNGLT